MIDIKNNTIFYNGSTLELGNKIEKLPNIHNKINFSCDFDGNLHNVPNQIINLTFSHLYNKPIYGLCSKDSILYITFGWNFNQSVDDLPCNLLQIIFGFHFNQSIDNLPNNLIYLKLGDKFNKSINYLPNNLEILIFGEYFNKSVDFLPNKLLELHLGYSFDYSLDNIPNSIQKLYIPNKVKYTQNIKLLNKRNTTVIYLI